MLDTTNFSHRHIGPNQNERNQMLELLGLKSSSELIEKAAPAAILNCKGLDLPAPLSEPQFLRRAREIASKNQVLKSLIGQGYYGTQTPLVILRNIMENPAWYTSYTPYQAEISQGRMEALLNFQTMVLELTGLEIANSSLLDEATAAAEAINLCNTVNRKSKSKKIFVSQSCFKQTIEVIQSRALPMGWEVIIGNPETFDFSEEVFATVVQYPDIHGDISDLKTFIDKSHENSALSIVAADILALTLLQAPGHLGADVVVGSTQRFGVPMGFGGPHAGYMATKDKYKRNIPGRIIGVSIDQDQQPALRLALQTREQHIRREKATSNICTAQVLLAVMASMYGVYHGPQGLKSIALTIAKKTKWLAERLKEAKIEIINNYFFDTITFSFSSLHEQQDVLKRALKAGFNLGVLNETTLSLSVDETTSNDDLVAIVSAISNKDFSGEVLLESTGLSKSSLRPDSFMNQPVFNSYHSETEMLRYIRRLENKDLSLANAMIPLGSCTMKLNATAELTPVTWDEFGNIHPFAPLDQAAGYLEMINEFEKWLCEITGYSAISFQPNAGSQGEYSGLLVIKKYLESKGEGGRNICLIPSSAHGTNPASAVLAGMKVVVIACDDSGNIDMTDLKTKTEMHSQNLAALMVTYPSTHGVFEETIIDICDLIHENGGQVYMDGANLNALVGICQPGILGPDVSHLNLHKTFAIPHGGGGPGVGPIGVREHLAPYLPTHSVVPEAGPKDGIQAVSAAPWGSASILPISWGYVAMLGAEGLKQSTEVSILSANYIAKKLSSFFPVLYKGQNGYVAHECILDVRGAKEEAGITVDDIAKRLIDYGFHAPTMSWPVPGTLMIEPTESENLAEIDRFCDAMIDIARDIDLIKKGEVDKDNNVLKNAPHSLNHMTASHWNHPYSREKAIYPVSWVKDHKFWPQVGRVDNAYGDRNLVCSCPTVESYATHS